jgi:L-ascorbate metabolism protein UlaG (beta-lactamase superfamily)
VRQDGFILIHNYYFYFYSAPIACGMANKLQPGGLMYKKLSLLPILMLMYMPVSAQNPLEKDTIKTSQGDLVIAFIGHGSLLFCFKGAYIHVDPWSKAADYDELPGADFVLLTHDHPDHLDSAALKTVRSRSTVVLMAPACAGNVEGAMVMENGLTKTIDGYKIEAVPAYNLVHKRKDGKPFHPRGEGNGYVITFGDKRVYVAGDTENIPEMKDLKDIHIAFLPMNLKPEILYPYHYGNTDTSKLLKLMKDQKHTEVRIRNMK